MPFDGEWYTGNGGVTKNTSHSWEILPQRFAYDFIIVDEEGLINIAEVQINIDKRIVTKGNKEINLTSQEYELLGALAINRNIALSREKLLDIAWGMNYYGDFRTVDVHICRLRKKLELENNIKTVFKYGYRLEL